jgi:hypothetical protein
MPGRCSRLHSLGEAASSYDDADDYESGIEEAKIYPRALRSKALNLMNYDGPPGYDKLAMTIEGCPPK